MPIRFVLIAVPLFALAGPALANSWKFTGDGEVKFGFAPRGSNNYDPIWFRCEGGQISVSAAVGERRPPDGQSRATLASGGQSATIEGGVPDEDFDGVYSIDATIARDHPAFGLLAGGGAITYQPAGGKRQSLGANGLKDALSRFLSACR